jgi:hypothetical protein
MNGAQDYFNTGYYKTYVVYIDRRQVDVFNDRSSAMTVLFNGLLSEKLQHDIEDSYIIQLRHFGHYKSIEECVYKVAKTSDTNFAFVKVISYKTNTSEYTTIYSPHDTDVFDNMFNYNLFSQLKDVDNCRDTVQNPERRKYASAPRCVNTRRNIRPLPTNAVPTVQSQSLNKPKDKINTNEEQSLKEILKKTMELSAPSKPIESTRLIENVVLFKEPPKNVDSNKPQVVPESDSETETTSGEDTDEESLDDEETKKLEELLDNMILTQQTLTNTVQSNKKTIDDDRDNLVNFECELRFQKMLQHRENEKNEEKKRVFDADINVYQKIKRKINDPEMNMTEDDVPDLFEAKYYVFKYLDVKGYLDAITTDDEKSELYRLYCALYDSRFPPDDKYAPPEEYVNEVLEFMSESFMPEKPIQTIDNIMEDLNKGCHSMFKEDPNKRTSAETSVPYGQTGDSTDSGDDNSSDSSDSDN